MIVSIYLKEHEYLINSPQVINLGGEYIYSFEEERTGSELFKKLTVKKSRNKKYVKKFFNIIDSECEISLLSAIVGENGVGKSSLLDVLRRYFKKNTPFPHSECVILVEEKGKTKVLKNNLFKKIVCNDTGTELERISNEEQYQTIYYSPHYDLKNNYFDEYDISLDNFIRLDLKNTDEKGTNENGWKYDLTEELLFKNSMRQLEFMNSEIYKSKNVFRDIFNIPNYEVGVLCFRDVTLKYNSNNEINFWNTPQKLRPIIKLIFNTADEEIKHWHIYRDGLTETNKDIKQALITQYILERFIIKAYLSLIVKQMEKTNDWLDEGCIDEPYNLERFESKSALDIFRYFIKESKIEKGKFSKKIFNYNNVFLLFDKLYQIIRREKNPQKISNQSINVKVSEIQEVLELHRKVITQLIDYYPRYENLTDENNSTDGFISFRPTDKKLSSGENALLNFYSKLYEFVRNKLEEERKSLPDKKNYILLLDEADLGFHPMWKKKFINTILKSIPYFFENLTTKPNIQIIITTHDPLSLSDIPNNNVVFLKRNNDFCSVVGDKDKIMKTFGANISNLLSNSFFIKDGLIGDFSKSKIDEVIEWINKHKKAGESKKSDTKFQEELSHYKNVIELIDEKIIKLKLSEMISDLVDDDEYYNQTIKNEIELLKTKLR